MTALVRRRKYFPAIVFIVSALWSSSPAWATDDSARLYHKFCGTCHGDQGDGRGRAGASLSPAPTDFTGTQFGARFSREKMMTAIGDGIPGTAMVGYRKRLSQDQISALVDYIGNNFVAGKRATHATVLSGKELYIEHCSACHGDDGNTAVWARNGLKPPPRNFTTSEARETLSRERMITSVTHGRPGTAMMSFQKRLTETEIEAVVNFIRSQFMRVNDARIPEEDDTVFRYPGGLTANAKDGQAFYLSNCFTCHGVSGEGNGPRAHFNTPRPRNFTTEETARLFDRAGLFHAIKQGKKGTVMPAWQTVLTDQQVADVAEFVYTTFVSAEKKSPQFR